MVGGLASCNYSAYSFLCCRQRHSEGAKHAQLLPRVQQAITLSLSDMRDALACRVSTPPAAYAPPVCACLMIQMMYIDGRLGRQMNLLVHTHTHTRRSRWFRFNGAVSETERSSPKRRGELAQTLAPDLSHASGSVSLSPGRHKGLHTDLEASQWKWLITL